MTPCAGGLAKAESESQKKASAGAITLLLPAVSVVKSRFVSGRIFAMKKRAAASFA